MSFDAPESLEIDKSISRAAGMKENSAREHCFSARFVGKPRLACRAL
jgi:hypothetical protein